MKSCNRCYYANSSSDAIDCVLAKHPRFPYRFGSLSISEFWKTLEYALGCSSYLECKIRIKDDPDRTEDDERLWVVYNIYKNL